MPTQDYRFIEMRFKVCLMVPNTDLGISPHLSNNFSTIKCDKQGSHFGSAEPAIPLHDPTEK